jgi:hypothetical protein
MPKCNVALVLTRRNAYNEAIAESEANPGKPVMTGEEMNWCIFYSSIEASSKDRAARIAIEQSTDPNIVTSATSAAPGWNRSITRRTRSGSWVPQRLPFPIYSDGLSNNTRMAPQGLRMLRPGSRHPLPTDEGSF